MNIDVKCEFLSYLLELKKAPCVHFTIVVPQISCCLDKEKPSDVPRGEVEFSICFSIVYAQKYCPSSTPVFMKFKNVLHENVKICTLFSHFASVYWLCPWAQLGDFCPPDALAPSVLDNSWSTSCETPPLQPIPISVPSTLLAVAPQTHWGNVRSPITAGTLVPAVLMATSHSYGNGQTLTTHRIRTS